MVKWGWKAMKMRDGSWDLIEDCMVTNVEEEGSNVSVIKMNMQFTNEDMTIFEKNA